MIGFLSDYSKQFTVPNLRELTFFQKYHHKNLLQCLGIVSFAKQVHEYLVLEYMDHDLAGLMQHLPDKKVFHLDHLKCIARQLFEGLMYVHERGVMHRDLKVGNLLMNSRGELKIADFGFAKEKQIADDEDGHTNRVCTVWYRSIEVLLGDTHYGFPLDMWGAGCVLAEMFIKFPLFHTPRGRDSEQVKRILSIIGHPTDSEWAAVQQMEQPWAKMWRVPKTKFPRRLEAYLVEKSAGYVPIPPMAVDLIARLLAFDPSKRPSAREVLSHPFFTTELPGPCHPHEIPVIQGSWHEFECKERVK
ncbi:kinase-like domain-containing protein, partial [Fimicolochytrium jonesii]|uniref:kinase-like domain-containing protein n=1 Tax=Fimicolochytrium jonesii TaxID=1396493 RepID=UPI0022FECB1B